MTFIYTPPHSPYLFSEWVSPTEKVHNTMFTESQLRAEVERVRRETVEACQDKVDAILGKNLISASFKELLK